MTRTKQNSTDFPSIESDDQEAMVEIVEEKDKTRGLFGGPNKPKQAKKSKFPFRRGKKELVIPGAVEFPQHLPEVKPPTPTPAKSDHLDGIVNEVLEEVTAEVKKDLLKNPELRKKLRNAMEEQMIREFEVFLQNR
jgi:hypothetical protein